MRPKQYMLERWWHKPTPRPNHSKKRDARTTVRFTGDELAKVQWAARARDMTVGAYIRWIVTEQAVFDVYGDKSSIKSLDEMELEMQERFIKQQEERAAVAREETTRDTHKVIQVEEGKGGSISEATELESAFSNLEFVEKLCLALATQIEFARFDTRGLGEHISDSKNHLMRLLGYNAPEKVCPNEQKDHWDRVRFTGYWKA